jgi:hypothetical protein
MHPSLGVKPNRVQYETKPFVDSSLIQNSGLGMSGYVTTLKVAGNILSELALEKDYIGTKEVYKKGWLVEQDRKDRLISETGQLYKWV